MQTPGSREIFRFRDFELDVAAYELRRQGRPVKLGRQQMDLLILLVESRRQLVSRGDIVDRLWGKDVFVDVETGVNTAISKVRQALRDSPEDPAFVETVPGRGYRFIAAVEVVSPGAGSPSPHLEPSPSPSPVPAPVSVSVSETESVSDVPSQKSEVRPSQTSVFVLQSFSSGSCDWPGRRDDGDRVGCLEAAQRRRGRLTGDTRRAAVREPRQRSRARLPGRGPDRGDQRVARADRSRAPERQGPDAALQGHHENGRRDRP